MSDPLTQFTRLIDEAFNNGDLRVLDGLVSPDFVEHQSSPAYRGDDVRSVGDTWVWPSA